MKIRMHFLFLLLFPTFIFCQQSSRYGDVLPTVSALGGSVVVRAFVVFAEVLNDPHYNDTFSLPNGQWVAGSMPPNPSQFVDNNFSSSLQSFVTRFFYLASFEKFIILGDYYPNLVQIDSSQIQADGDYGVEQVIHYLDTLADTAIITLPNYLMLSPSSSDFDSWSGLGYRQKSYTPDGDIDLFLIFWRINSKLSPERNGSHGGTCDSTIKGKSCSNYYITYCSNAPYNWMHEISHALIGDNKYHSGGAGLGNGTFLSDYGGYSILGGYEKNLASVNGWDRYWLGWKNTNKSLYISVGDALNAPEYNTDLTYGCTLPNSGIYTLRDFNTTGDAVRIQLPYIKNMNSTAKQQYLWIENHQILSNMCEYDTSKPKGIRLNIEVGNDTLTQLFYNRSLTNSICPLNSFGNWDFSYPSPPLAGCTISTSSDKSNPLTGYSVSEYGAYDYTNQSGYPNNIFDTEYIRNGYIYNGQIIMGQNPLFGNQYDAFSVGQKINLSNNPTPSPLLTYWTKDRKNGGSGFDTPCYLDNRYLDNRYILLNGIQIEILEQLSNGDVRIQIQWNKYDITNNVRWCGPIVLYESVFLKEGYTITLDQGLTPTRPVDPITFNGQDVFADPTIFTCKDSSQFVLEQNSNVIVKDNSAFILDSGSVLSIDDGSKFDIQSGSTLVIKNGANVFIDGTGRIDIESGAYICIDTGANIYLYNALSTIYLHYGYIAGVDTNILKGIYNCSSSPHTFQTTGYGHINAFAYNLYIQNDTLSDEQYVPGNYISAGTHVTDSISQGPVFIENGAKVIFDADATILLDSGFEVKTGGDFEAK